MSHTSGTWEQLANIIYCGDGVICQLSEPRKTDYIEHCPVDISSPDWKEAMDNGKLIKAAPQMLAALEMVVLAGRPAINLSPAHLEIRLAAFEAGMLPGEYVMNAVLAAIAEAKGEE